MQTKIIHSSERSTVELVCDEEKYIRRTVYSECAVYNALKDAPSCFLPEIYSVDIADGKTVICEEYIDGKSLAHTDLSEKQAENVMIQLCSALEFIHKLGIVHRDIKPSNILICDDGRIKLIDFEAARFVKENSEKDTRCLGTEGFAPPEQYGFAQTDFRTDIYAAGQTMKILLGSLSAKPAYKKIIQRCISFDPDNRYQSAAELKNALLNLHRKAFYIAVGVLLSAAAVLAITMSFLSQTNTVYDEPAYVETVTASVQTVTEETSEPITSKASETSKTTNNTETSSEEAETVTAESTTEAVTETETSQSETEVTSEYQTSSMFTDDSTVYITDYDNDYTAVPEYVPEYDKDDKIFFCEDSTARIFLAKGEELFKNFEKYTMYTDIDNSGRNECITVGVDIYGMLTINLATAKIADGLQYNMDICGYSLQNAFNEYNLDEKTIVQITFFELSGDNLMAVTIGDKETYNFTGFFTVKNDEPMYLGRGWGETYARVYGFALNEFLSTGGQNIYYYMDGELTAINAYDYSGSGWRYDDDFVNWIYDYTPPDWIYDFS